MYSYLFLEEDSELEASMPETEEFLAHHFPRLVAVFWTVRDSEGLPQVIHLLQKVSLSTLSSILRGAGSIHFSSYQSRGVIEGTGSHASLIRPDIDLWLAHGYSEMFDIPEPTPHNFRPIVGTHDHRLLPAIALLLYIGCESIGDVISLQCRRDDREGFSATGQHLRQSLKSIATVC
jgi:hypothetical protein